MREYDVHIEKYWQYFQTSLVLLIIPNCSRHRMISYTNSDKQELCNLNFETLHLESCISELEVKLRSKNSSNANSSLGLDSQMVKENAFRTVNADVCITSSGCSPETNNCHGNVNQPTEDSDLDPPVSEMNNHPKESIEAVHLCFV